MDIDNSQKYLAREFYQQNNELLSDWLMSNRQHEGITDKFKIIASVRIFAEDSLVPSKLEIQKINEHIPRSVGDAFERHFWYSQWNFADLFLIKFPIDDRNFFLLWDYGFENDGWANDIDYIEIFSEQGDFFGATRGGISWSERQFTREDFKDAKIGSPPPLYIGDESDAVYYDEVLWTEEMLVKIEQQNQIIRYSSCRDVQDCLYVYLNQITSI